MLVKIGVMAGVLCAGTAFGQAADVCANAPIVPAGTVAFDLTSATNDGSSSCGFTSGSNVDQWVRYTATATGFGSFSTCGGAGFDTVITVFASCGGAELACNDDSTCGLQSTVSLLMNQGTTYLIRIAPYGAGVGGAGNLTITDPTPFPAGTWAENGDAGDTPATAQQIGGSGDLPAIVGNIGPAGDADMYSFNLCAPATFSATTTGNGTEGDTQLFLFNSSGVGIAMNDDDPIEDEATSRLSSSFTASLSAGTYLIAVTRYNNDPRDAGGQLIWANTPFDAERAPDGPGAAGAVSSWSGGGGTGVYTITLTGACAGSGGGGCAADTDDGTRTGTPDGAVTIDDLIYFLIAFEDGNLDADLDNGTRTGTTDGAVTIDDLVYFLIRFEAGC